LKYIFNFYFFIREKKKFGRQKVQEWALDKLFFNIPDCFLNISKNSLDAPNLPRPTEKEKKKCSHRLSTKLLQQMNKYLAFKCLMAITRQTPFFFERENSLYIYMLLHAQYKRVMLLLGEHVN
jgi:hypothetical protein